MDLNESSGFPDDWDDPSPPADDLIEPTDELTDDLIEPTDELTDDLIESTDEPIEPTDELTDDLIEPTDELADDLIESPAEPIEPTGPEPPSLDPSLSPGVGPRHWSLPSMLNQLITRPTPIQFGRTGCPCKHYDGSWKCSCSAFRPTTGDPNTCMGCHHNYDEHY